MVDYFRIISELVIELKGVVKGKTPFEREKAMEIAEYLKTK